jgi:hypothetical protein
MQYGQGWVTTGVHVSYSRYSQQGPNFTSFCSTRECQSYTKFVSISSSCTSQLCLGGLKSHFGNSPALLVSALRFQSLDSVVVGSNSNFMMMDRGQNKLYTTWEEDFHGLWWSCRKYLELGAIQLVL